MNPIKQFIEESRLKPNHSEYATIIALLNVVKGVIEGRKEELDPEGDADYLEALDDILKDLEIK